MRKRHTPEQVIKEFRKAKADLQFGACDSLGQAGGGSQVRQQRGTWAVRERLIHGRLRGASLMQDTKQKPPRLPRPTLPIPAPLAPVLMIIFWMLLGGAAGIKLAQSMWQLLGWGGGEVSIAVPVGGVVGALAGALLGLISNPRLLVLLMAVFAGSAAGAVAGKVPWGDVGEIGGQVAGGLVGGIAWAVWLLIGGRKEPLV